MWQALTSQPPPKPHRSCIEEIDDFDARTYRWKPPSGGAVRCFLAAFLILWLCGWAVGFGTALAELVRNDHADSFLLLWLAGWTLGGLFALTMLYIILRPSRPESMTLANTYFRYDPGSTPLAFVFNPWYAMRHSNPDEWFARPFRRRKPIELAKSELGPVVLDRVGERQRLYFDVGADRVEIGEHLREPEREWLAAVIEAWKAA